MSNISKYQEIYKLNYILVKIIQPNFDKLVNYTHIHSSGTKIPCCIITYTHPIDGSWSSGKKEAIVYVQPTLPSGERTSEFFSFNDQRAIMSGYNISDHHYSTCWMNEILHSGKDLASNFHTAHKRWERIINYAQEHLPNYNELYEQHKDVLERKTDKVALDAWKKRTIEFGYKQLVDITFTATLLLLERLTGLKPLETAIRDIRLHPSLIVDDASIRKDKFGKRLYERIVELGLNTEDFWEALMNSRMTSAKRFAMIYNPDYVGLGLLDEDRFTREAAEYLSLYK